MRARDRRHTCSVISAASDRPRVKVAGSAPFGKYHRRGPVVSRMVSHRPYAARARRPASAAATRNSAPTTPKAVPGPVSVHQPSITA